jgi:shikimate dehydrogenase
VLVNATPMGMRGSSGEGRAPVDVAGLTGWKEDAVVMDTVYAPARTPLLAAAEARGWRTIDGVSMFVRQAGMQFEGWTGRPAPVDLFERLVREAEARGDA